MIPRQSTIGIPVCLIELGASPVRITADVGYAGHSRLSLPLQGAVNHPSHGRARTAGVRIRGEYFAKERSEIHQVRVFAEILFRDLKFDHLGSLRHGAEERMKGLAGLEVERTVLGLEQDVRAKVAIERGELVV